MRKSSRIFTLLGAAVAGMLAMVPGVRQAGNMPTMVNSSNRIAANGKQKSTPVVSQAPRNTVINEIGGMPFASVVPNYGMSPKEYGQLYGNGGSKRSNRLRYSHDAKVKRRNAC